MFKRFSTNYMVLLFLVDMLVVQVGLGLAIRLRFLLPFGPDLRPVWVPEFVYAPTPAMHLGVGSTPATTSPGRRRLTAS